MTKNKPTKKVDKVKKIPKTKKEKAVKESYMAGVKSELSKVKWPSKSEVLKYTIATIAFIVILVAFFELLTILMALLGGA